MANNILVIRLSSLGDVILTAPVYKNLKARWPDCRISVLVKPQFAPALTGNPDIDEIIPFAGLSQALGRIRSGGFTHLLDLHGNLRSFLLRRFSGVAQVSTYRKDALARRLFVFFGLDSPSLQKHTVDRYLEALAAWGVPGSQRWLELGDYGTGGNLITARRVLIIQSAFLGDALLTVPLARELKAILPECRLSVLTLEKTADVFRGCPWVDEVLIDDKRGVHGGLMGPWRLSRSLKGQAFDLAVIPHRSFRSAWLAWLCAIPRRLGFASSAGRLLLTHQVPFTWLMHDLERNLALLQPLKPGLKSRSGQSVYFSKDAVTASAMDARLRAEGIEDGESLVGVHPGSAWPTKRWLPERFTELCRRFKAQGRRVVLVGGPQDEALCQQVAGSTGALNWAGRTDLAELKALMGRLSLFVTNDSGPMHMATASGVKTLAIFGPTTRELGFFPYGPGHRVLEAALACRPCGLHGARACPEVHFLCMRLISVDQAWQASQEMLSEPALAS